MGFHRELATPFDWQFWCRTSSDWKLGRASNQRRLHPEDASPVHLGRVYVTTPGSSFVNANIGVLAVGALDKAEDVVSGFGVIGTLQKSLRGGYQVSSSSSGTLGGPSIGTPGVSASAGYGGWFTIGGQRR